MLNKNNYRKSSSLATSLIDLLHINNALWNGTCGILALWGRALTIPNKKYSVGIVKKNQLYLMSGNSGSCQGLLSSLGRIWLMLYLSASPKLMFNRPSELSCSNLKAGKNLGIKMWKSSLLLLKKVTCFINIYIKAQQWYIACDFSSKGLRFLHGT